MNIDWKLVWEKVKPVLLNLLIALLSGGVAGYQCGHHAAESAVKAHLTAAK